MAHLFFGFRWLFWDEEKRDFSLDKTVSQCQDINVLITKEVA
jgi:hypothetical protein